MSLAGRALRGDHSGDDDSNNSSHVWNVYYLPGTGLRALLVLRFHLHTFPVRASLLLFHFKDQQCEMQRDEAACQ